MPPQILLELRLGKQKLETAATLVDVPVAGGVVVVAAGVDEAGPQVDERRAAGAVVRGEKVERVGGPLPASSRRGDPRDVLDVRRLALDQRALKQLPLPRKNPKLAGHVSAREGCRKLLVHALQVARSRRDLPSSALKVAIAAAP